MSSFTDIFIRRPVLATVISLLILIIGIRSILAIEIRQFPRLENTTITVVTAYPGASADIIQGFVTTPLEKRIASAEGVDYIASTSLDGLSQIRAQLKLNFDPDDGYTNVLAKVQEGLEELPEEAERPIIKKLTGVSVFLMYIAFSSNVLNSEQITDYITRVIQPTLETIPGVAAANVLGGTTYAMRIWLDKKRMAGFNISAQDVSNAIKQKNIIASAGSTDSKYVQIAIKPNTDLRTPEQFQKMVIKSTPDKGLVRMQDVAKVELGAEDYDSVNYFNNERAVFVGIDVAPKANPLQVITDIRKKLETSKANFPKSLVAKVGYDATQYIRSAIKEVVITILEATAIVSIVIFLFLGSLRIVTIPVVTIPVSLIGVVTFMLFLGYSINLLTLLALVLAIGMVVDDAIVVVENIYRHIERGESPKEAAKIGVREIAMPIIGMTITLAAVYAPIGFLGGLTGALFKEFAFTLASAVILSGVIALTLSPMMCSRILTSETHDLKFVHFLDEKFDQLKSLYARYLAGAIEYKSLTIFFALVVLVSCVFLYLDAKSELSPQEDQGIVLVQGRGPQSANLEYMEHFRPDVIRVAQSTPGVSHLFLNMGSSGNPSGVGDPNRMFFGVVLKPWEQRQTSQNDALQYMQGQLSQLPGIQFQAFTLPAVPTGGFGLPIQFQVQSTKPITELFEVAQAVVGKAMQSSLFLFATTNNKVDKPTVSLNINRSKAATLGIDIGDIASALSTAYGENNINWISLEGRNYRVIPQVEQVDRFVPSDINQLYVQTASGEKIPLKTVADISFATEPSSLTRFQQLNTVEIIGVMAPGITIGDGVNFLQQEADKIFPSDVTYDFAGESRRYLEEGQELVFTFVMAIILIYLVLAALFENFRHPLVIIISVPMAVSGALIAINLGIGGATINIYTQIGIITLIGLISKHGILVVEFANTLRAEKGLAIKEAVIEAAAIRLRPVLMTTFSIIFGVMPLVLATGAGAGGRFNIGLVIASGMLVGTLFTLFVIPAMYTLKTRSILLFIFSAVLIASGLYFLIY